MKNINKIVITLLIISFSFLITACSTKAKVYKPNIINNEKIKQFSKKIDIVLSKNSINDSSASTRLSSVEMPSEESVSVYIKNAFITELKYARAYSSKDAGITLNLELKDIELHTRFGRASWDFKIQVSSSNGKIIELEYIHKFESLHASEFDTYDAANAFKPAVQNLIQEIIYNKEFVDLLN